jgi:protein ImuA
MKAARARERVLEDLKVRIRTIERRPPELRAAPETVRAPTSEPADPLRLPPDRQPAPAWTFAAPALDALLGPEGLAIDAVHEVKPPIPEEGSNFAAGWAAARAFTLALGVRRCHAMGLKGDWQAPVLCCWPAVLAHELAPLYGPGLRALGLDPDRLLIAETANAAEALWALEEGLRSASLALALGVLEEVALTPARRLALAAAAHRTPCLLLTHPRAAATAATATRWRVGPCPSAPHPFDARAPGAPRFALMLERCRSRPAAEAVSVSLEWCNEAYRFRMASRLADRAAAAGRAEGRAG